MYRFGCILGYGLGNGLGCGLGYGLGCGLWYELGCGLGYGLSHGLGYGLGYGLELGLRLYGRSRNSDREPLGSGNSDQKPWNYQHCYYQHLWAVIQKVGNSDEW